MARPARQSYKREYDRLRIATVVGKSREGRTSSGYGPAFNRGMRHAAATTGPCCPAYATADGVNTASTSGRTDTSASRTARATGGNAAAPAAGTATATTPVADADRCAVAPGRLWNPCLHPP